MTAQIPKRFDLPTIFLKAELKGSVGWVSVTLPVCLGTVVL